MAARSLGDQRQQSDSSRAVAHHSEQNHLSPRWRVLKAIPGYAHNQIGYRLGGVVGPANHQRAVRLQPRPQPVGLGILRQGIPSAAARLDLHFVGACGLRRIDADFADAQGFDDGVDNLL